MVVCTALFDSRRREGWICDGHGDLLADDVYLLDDGPRALDCVEFDDSLCHGDVIEDVAFLAMDLERLGHPTLAAEWISAYERAVGAELPASLVHFYIAYRAQVRAKVAALRAGQEGAVSGGGEDPLRLLELCDRHLRVATPRLVVVGGAPGTGKSTASRVVAEHYGWRILRSDEIRKAPFAAAAAAADDGATAEDSADAAYGSGIYRPDHTNATYRTMLEAASQQLAMGESVVLDASFTDARHRERARRVAGTAGAELVELRCVLAPEEAARRIESRRRIGTDASDATAAIASRMAGVTDPWPEATEIPTGDPPQLVAARLVNVVDSVIWRGTTAPPTVLSGPVFDQASAGAAGPSSSY